MSEASTVDALESQRKYRKDYVPVAVTVRRVDLDISLFDEYAEVRAELECERLGDGSLLLDCEFLEWQECLINGMPYQLSEEEKEATQVELALEDVDMGSMAIVQTTVRIEPKKNTSLMGLYHSGAMFCTQCEAEGFRRITPYPDRPDVMASFKVTLHADKETCPVLLANGNRVNEGEEENGRHYVTWIDPFLKPCYLFAMVAGQLTPLRDTFTTQSGREIALEIWVEERNADKCDYAMKALKKSMRWDEEVYGREYDLDLFMIVAVDDFNFGAMENKGLNIFNAKLLLARPDTATDTDYERIEGVVAHEYFHNWTGNRVTCRDWFQLTLKEGLTVFRDQEFSADMNSHAVKRIDDVQLLRAHQFAEDASPMKHPIRPESYIAMDNFYTVTVYEKGAEVIRMYHTLLGPEGFRKGTDLYFERHDGSAVTCDDFRMAMADANNWDSAQFEEWYKQAGTPVLRVKETYNADGKTYRVELSQENEGYEKPLLIPVRLALFTQTGEKISAQCDQNLQAGDCFLLSEKTQSITWSDITEHPVLSILRGLSAPVNCEFDQSTEDRLCLAQFDDDHYNRWDAAQGLSFSAIADLMNNKNSEKAIESVNSIAHAALSSDADPALRALTLGLPSYSEISQKQDLIDPAAIQAARKELRSARFTAMESQAAEVYAQCSEALQGNPDETQARGLRRLRNVVLSELLHGNDSAYADLALKQFADAKNMTDSYGALSALVLSQSSHAEEVLSTFFDRWQNDNLVLDKWFTLQALIPSEAGYAAVEKLQDHASYTWTTPNRVRALFGAFSVANFSAFHLEDGRSYRLLTDACLKMDGINQRVAARLAGAFNHWKRFVPQHRDLMETELERLAAADLSKETGEIVKAALA